MSVINTCRLEGVNAFEYLTELQRHADRVRASPADWLPWNYKSTLAGLLPEAFALPTFLLRKTTFREGAA
jgi:hypothetical protein